MTTHAETHSARLTYARVAGFAFIFYIAAGIFSMSLPDGSPIVDAFGLLLNLSALVLGVTLYMLTREHGPALALLALACRALEAVHEQSPIFFSIGSLLFCWLLLRGRMIPITLAWLGVAASALLIVILPLQLAEVIPGAGWASSATWMIWMPMLVFELALALWLLVKGVAAPQIIAV
ncbi:MAG: DUF4386 family protein [Anaerolineales bacterium]|nr:DUF4386 family protein [Anaerolineales bacterium]